MATPKRRPTSRTLDLTSQTDFQLLNALTDLVSNESSPELMSIAWEIMRRYTTSMEEQEPSNQASYDAILGDARWGDAKRVENIFGIKRSKLYSLLNTDKIKSKSLADSNDGSDQTAQTKGKRLFCLISILDYLESEN